MNFRRLFPMSDFGSTYSFDKCHNLKDFLHETVAIYKALSRDYPQIKESCLSVYMAFRDRCPDLIQTLDPLIVDQLNADVNEEHSNIIHLRNRVVEELSKVA